MADSGQEAPGGAFAPLREPVFRRIWSASLLSNFGQLFLGVGAAWEMTQLSNSATMVSLVQTALMVPLMFVTLPAGAIADMFDRRRIAVSGLAFSAVMAAVLAAIAFMGLTTPWLLLLFCALIGAGVALYSPSWQASIPEQVSRENLPAAVALGTISYNVARSFGPALGGVIVLAAGAQAVFGLTSVLYLPLLFSFVLWKRRHVPSRLPPERIDRAMIGGARYALHSPGIRTALTRIFAFGLCTATASGLAPLVAKELLRGDAAIYGILLGAQGVGAVLGALFVAQIKQRLTTESAVRLFAVATGLALIVIGFSTNTVLTCAGFFVIGMSNILTVAILNVTVQMSAPRWVTARALSLYSSAITAGIGIGAYAWGEIAGEIGVALAFITSGVAVAATVLLGFVLPLPDEDSDTSMVEIGYEPEVALALTLRSGPIVVEVEYDVEPGQAREFYDTMMNLQRVRKRLGGFDWSLARDIENPALWTERYHCPTWGDYLRMRDRYAAPEYQIQAEADSFNRQRGRRVTRRLERPFGSVRWKADSLDPQQETVGYIGP
ncbi:MFS family permease [Novosphingobium chloroacetimidivorans]|uniref:MFS family permease n=1 Tax=Novosphingobium chloroacetimidivorans TaxID=1428314 RepID=A0A7W7KCW9_9SPHN|nr:MFS transporter [Novosphingobium chloroacetimidivorans]MBB4860131.1 MFS family permease [Novosphingobium chloroacetimidivorans]